MTTHPTLVPPTLVPRAIDRAASWTPACALTGARAARFAFLALAALHGAAASAVAQPAAPPPASGPYTLSVTSQDGAPQVTLKAEGAPLSAIAADLSTRLRAPVRLAPSVRTETISVDLAASPLEPALASLAARVLVDYEIRQNGPPVPREIHLLGVDDPEPPRNTDSRGMSQGLLISGHTEQSTDPSDTDSLRILGDSRQLSVTSKKEPLSVVATAIGETLGVPVEIRYDAKEPIDIDIRDVSAEDLIPRISPNLRLQVRVDVNKAERMPLRLVVARPATK